MENQTVIPIVIIISTLCPKSVCFPLPNWYIDDETVDILQSNLNWTSKIQTSIACINTSVIILSNNLEKINKFALDQFLSQVLIKTIWTRPNGSSSTGLILILLIIYIINARKTPYLEQMNFHLYFS